MSILVNGETRQITMPVGDTGTFVIELDVTEPVSGLAVFAICKKTTSRYETVHQDAVEVVDNSVTIYMKNADTEALAPGEYFWDVRILSDPETDAETGNTVETDAIGTVTSLFALEGLPKFTLVGVAVDV